MAMIHQLLHAFRVRMVSRKTSTELASELKIPLNSFTRYESGEVTKIRASVLEKIPSVFNLSSEETKVLHWAHEILQETGPLPLPSRAVVPGPRDAWVCDRFNPEDLKDFDRVVIAPHALLESMPEAESLKTFRALLSKNVSIARPPCEQPPSFVLLAGLVSARLVPPLPDAEPRQRQKEILKNAVENSPEMTNTEMAAMLEKLARQLKELESPARLPSVWNEDAVFLFDAGSERTGRLNAWFAIQHQASARSAEACKLLDKIRASKESFSYLFSRSRHSTGE